MIYFTVENSFTKAVAASDEHAFIDSVLRYKVPNFEIIRRRMGFTSWDGTRSFYSKGMFLTGLLDKVTSQCRENGIEFKINDSRPPVGVSGPAPFVDMLKGITLYDYQLRTVQESLLKSRGVVQLPTGAGKTEIAIAITKAINQPTLFLTHRVNLLHQTAQRFAERLPELKKRIGVIGDSSYQTNFLTFATVQTAYSCIKKDLKRMYEELKHFQVLIIDEAHHSGADQFYKTVMLCNGARYRFGLTATPFMNGNVADDMYLLGLTGPVISRVTNSELIDAGVLAKPFFKFFTINEPSNIKSLRSWRDVYERGIVQNVYRNTVVSKQAAQLAKSGHKILIVVMEIAHGKLLRDLCLKEGLKAEFIDGGHSYTERTKALKWLAGEGNVIIVTNIFDEGIDVKQINAVILAAGTKTAPALFQRTGRAMRKKGEENYAVIVDFIDNQHPMLGRHSRSPLATVAITSSPSAMSFWRTTPARARGKAPSRSMRGL